MLHTGEAEVHGVNTAHCHLVNQKSQPGDLGSNPGFRGDSPATNCLIHGTNLETKINSNLI